METLDIEYACVFGNIRKTPTKTKKKNLVKLGVTKMGGT